MKRLVFAAAALAAAACVGSQPVQTPAPPEPPGETPIEPMPPPPDAAEQESRTDPRIEDRVFNTDAKNLERLLTELVCMATGGGASTAAATRTRRTPPWSWSTRSSSRSSRI